MLQALEWEPLVLRRAQARVCMFNKAANSLIAIPIDTYLMSLTSITRGSETQVLHSFHQICDNEALIIPGYSKIVERTTTYRHHGPVDRGV